MIPVLSADDAIVVVALNGDGGVVLLGAIDVVGPAVVGDHMVELRSRLVVLGTPGLSAVSRDDSAPVIAVDESLRIVGINPQAMVVSMWRGQQVKPSPAIHGAKHSGVKHVNRVR